MDKETDLRVKGSRWCSQATCCDSVDSAADIEQLLLSVLGPFAHGAEGTSVWFFDREGAQGLHDDSNQRNYMTSAFNRLDQVESYLDGLGYLDCHDIGTPIPENGGYGYLDHTSFDQDPWYHQFEVCRWGSGNTEAFVFCSRSSTNTKQITAYFKQSCHVWLDNADKGTRSDYSFEIPAGDVKVLKLQPA